MLLHGHSSAFFEMLIVIAINASPFAIYVLSRDTGPYSGCGVTSTVLTPTHAVHHLLLIKYSMSTHRPRHVLGLGVAIAEGRDN